jgi:hypothetical protein
MTAIPRRLQATALVADGDGYRLTLTFADGTSIEALVSFEQLDDLAEDIDRQLDIDDEWAEPTPVA